MLKIFLSSHGHFASGMQSSARILLGKLDNLDVFDAYVDEKSIQDALEEFYKTVTKEDQVILLSDLYGGSVNSAMYLYADRADTTLISGINLAFLLELASKESITREELEELVEISRSMLRIVEAEETTESTAEEDFF